MTIDIDAKTIWGKVRSWAPILSIIYLASTAVLKGLCDADLLKVCDFAYTMSTMGNLFGIVQYADPAMVQGLASVPAGVGAIYKSYLKLRARKPPAGIDPITLIKQGPGYRGPQ